MVKRLTEPSTWAGLGGLALMAKLFLPAHYHAIADWAAGAASGLAVALTEKARA